MTIVAPKKILIIDDEPDIRNVVQITLEIVGDMNSDMCSSGADALEYLQESQPDLILLDVMMPGMDGPETLKQIKSNSITENIPVIFMTAKVQPNEVEAYYEMGVVGVISKPFNPKDLVGAILKFWNKIHG